MSLSEQLQKLQLPGQSVIQQLSSAKISILFDSNTVAGLDNETILNIGISGFEELLSIDPVFQSYEHFFTKDTLKFQRNSLGKQEHTRLKEKIASYLLYLSPYLMIKAAQKTLEWLIRRYQVHIFDKNALMMCILPYHETKIFARIVQIFGKKESEDMWGWLISCQTNGVGFSTQSLIKQLADSNNRNLLTFIFKMAEDANLLLKNNPKSGLKLIFSFFARTVTCVIDSYMVLKEDFVSFLLPLIYTGLKSKVKDFVTSSYMIIAMICAKTQLSKDICKALQASLLKSMEPSWYEEGFLCFLTVLLHQKVKRLSARVCSLVLALDLDVFLNELVVLHLQIDIDQFIGLLLPHLCENSVEEEKCVVVLDRFIDELHLTGNQLNLLCSKLIERGVQYLKDEDDIGEAQAILKKLATRYSSNFDQTISKLFKRYEENDDSEELIGLKRLVNQCLSTTKHQIVEHTELPLVISLNHPESNIRCLAVQQLFETIKDDLHEFDNTFFKTSIIARFCDDSADVVMTILKFSKQITTLLSVCDILKILKQLIERTDHYFNVNELLLFTLQHTDFQQMTENVETFIYVFFVEIMHAFAGKKNKKVLEAFKNIKVNSEHPILQGIFTTISESNIDFFTKSKLPSNTVIEIYDKLLSNVADLIIKNENKKVIVNKLWSYKSQLPTEHDMHLIAILLIQKIIEKSKTFQLLDFSMYSKLPIMQCNEEKIQDVLQQPPSTMFTFVLEEYLNLLKEKSKDRVGVIYFSFISFLRSNIASMADVETPDISKQEVYQLLCELSTNMKSNGFYFQVLLKQFFKECFKNKSDLVIFLCDFCSVAINTRSDDQYTLTTLQVLQSLLTKKDDLKEAETCDKVISTYVSLLNNNIPVLRKTAIDGIHLIYSQMDDAKLPCYYIVEKLVEAKQEIILDEDYTKSVFQKMFTIKDERRKSEFSAFGGGAKSSKSGSAKQLRSFKYYLDVVGKASPDLQMALMNLIEQVDVKVLWKECLDILNELVSTEKTPTNVKTIISILKHMRKDSFDNMEEDILNAFLVCVKLDNADIHNECFDMIASQFYDKLLSSSKQEVLVVLMDLLLSSNSILKSTKIRTVLREINLSGEHVCFFLNKFNQEFDAILESNPSFTSGNVEPSLQTAMMRTVKEMLEALARKELYTEVAYIMVAIFSVFDRILRFSDASFEYYRQLCLSTLLTLMNQDVSSTLAADNFKSDLIVLCLQTSSDVTTNQHCLQVLSRAATLYPTQVLHNIMHIFTFMGGNMFRVDNEHTFHLIEQTIDSIIPVLIKKKEKEKEVAMKRGASTDGTEKIVIFILQTFIDSIPHCPQHRQQHILSYLLKVMGMKDHLFMAVILLLKKVIKRSDKSNVKQDFDELEVAPVSLEFCQRFLANFPVHIQVGALNQVLVYLKSMQEVKETPAKKKKIEGEDPLDMSSLNEKNSKVYQYTFVTFATTLLKDDIIIEHYSKLTKKNARLLTKSFIRFLDDLQSSTEFLKKHKDNSTNNEKATKFWTHLLLKTHNLIGHIYTLLPFDSFIEVVIGVLDKENYSSRKKSLESLCSKLSKVTQVDEKQESSLMELFDKIISLVQYKKSSTGNRESDVNKQLMLFVIKLLAVHLCSKYKDSFIKAIPVIVQLYAVEDIDNLVSINAMLCIAELSGYLQMEMLPYLPIFMKPLLSKVHINMNTNEAHSKNNELLLSSFIATVDRLLLAIPQFLSQYMSEILTKAIYCESVGIATNNTTLCSSVGELKSNISNLIPARVLYPAVQNIFDQLVEKDLLQLYALMEVVKTSFNSISKPDANKNHNKIILQIIKKALSLRSLLSVDQLENVRKVEDITIEAFCVLVMKLSENTLRPMYLELFKWATKQDDINYMISFYRLSVQLSSSLKSLYLLFVSNIILNAAKFLTDVNSVNTDRSNSCELIYGVVDTLRNCFHYDNQGFISKDRFELLMNPIIDQLDNTMFGKDYDTFVKEHLLKCLVSFASSTNDVTCWKSLNHQILLKTKSAQAHVRLACLQITQEIYQRMGESYMILIPETIPFLAEILEDDSVEVEQQCQQVIKTIEEISGESLQKYF